MKSGKGFMLMETLWALSILFVGLLICLESFSVAGRAFKKADEARQAKTQLQKEFFLANGLPQ